MPLVWVIAAVAAVGALAARRWAGTALVINSAIVAVVPFFVLMPWTLHLLTSPSALLMEAGLQRPGLASLGLHPQALLSASPGGPGLPPVWGDRRVADSGAGRPGDGPADQPACTGWAIAIAGLATALAVSTVQITTSGITRLSAPGLASPTAIAAARRSPPRPLSR